MAEGGGTCSSLSLAVLCSFTYKHTCPYHIIPTSKCISVLLLFDGAVAGGGWTGIGIDGICVSRRRVRRGGLRSSNRERERNDPRVPFHGLLKGSRATHRIPSKDAQRINSVKIKFRGERKQNNCNFVRIAHLL